MHERGFEAKGESMILENGRVCMKIAGREAGKYCVVLKLEDENFALITGPKSVTGVKRRKCNILHLEPTQEKFELKEDNDEVVANFWKSSGLIEKFAIQVPIKREFKKEIKEEKVKKKRFVKPKPVEA
jgi:large subunit ribosomal protein L14e